MSGSVLGTNCETAYIKAHRSLGCMNRNTVSRPSRSKPMLISYPEYKLVSRCLALKVHFFPTEQKKTVVWKNEIYLQTCKRLVRTKHKRCSVRLNGAS